MSEDSIATRARMACNCCGCPWPDHPTDTICNRYRPRPEPEPEPARIDAVSVAPYADWPDGPLEGLFGSSVVEAVKPVWLSGSSLFVFQRDIAEERIRDFLRAYVHESKHPDCLPSHKFHAILPDGQWRPFPTRVAAEWALLEAIGKRGKT